MMSGGPPACGRGQHQRTRRAAQPVTVRRRAGRGARGRGRGRQGRGGAHRRRPPRICRPAPCWWSCTPAAGVRRRWPISLKKLGAEVHPVRGSPRPAERADFVRREFRDLKVKVGDDTVTAVLDAVGSDIRELAAACSQLVADTGGHVDAAAVRRYHSGKAEVKGFDIADKAVAGDVAGAAEALRWAMMSGEPQVVLADALAEAVHAIARIGAAVGRPVPARGRAGLPPWRVQKAQKQARRWSRDSVAEAMRLVAALNADVKGAAADADYALETAVRRVAELAAEADQRLLSSELVERQRQSRLLVGGLVLVDDALAGGLVELAAGGRPATRRPCPSRRRRWPHGTRGPPCEARTSPTGCAGGRARW